MTGNLTDAHPPNPIRNPSFREKQANAFSSLPLPRKVGLRREKSLFAFTGFIAGLLVLTLALNAQAPTAVPIPKEPHHRLVLENEYVRVFRVSVPAHDATLLHQHDVPYLYVSLGPADVINAVQGKPEARIVMVDGQLGYSPGHFAHIARTDAGTSFDNVTIELLHPQGGVHNLCRKIIEGDLGQCSKTDTGPRGYIDEPLLETEELRVNSVTLQPKARFIQRIQSGCLYVSLDSSELQDDPGKPAIKLQPGDRFWVPAATILKLRNTAPNKARYLLLTVKQEPLRTRREGVS